MTDTKPEYLQSKRDLQVKSYLGSKRHTFVKADEKLHQRYRCIYCFIRW